jgi:hypothetical protein
MKPGLCHVVDAVWPTFEDEPTSQPPDLPEVGSGLASEGAAELPDGLSNELAVRFKEEEDRRARVEAKASALLAAIGLAVTLGSNMLFAAFRADFASGAVKYAAIVALIFAVIGLTYLSQGARYALLALSRTAYAAIGPEELLQPDVVRDAASLRRYVVNSYAKSAVKNRAATNRKVDDVHLAQLFVRNALVAFLAVAVFAVAAVCFVPVKVPVSPLPVGSAERCPPPARVIVSCATPSPPPPLVATPPAGGAVPGLVGSQGPCPVVRRPERVAPPHKKPVPRPAPSASASGP